MSESCFVCVYPAFAVSPTYSGDSRYLAYEARWSAVQEAEGAAQSADGARLRDVVARCAALGSERPRAAYATRNLEQVCAEW